MTGVPSRVWHLYVATVAATATETVVGFFLLYGLSTCGLLIYNQACYAFIEIPPFSHLGTALVIVIASPILWLTYVVFARAGSRRHRASAGQSRPRGAGQH